MRARVSLPALLSELEEERVVAAAAAVSGGFGLLVIAVAAWVSGLPLLFPSLGPSAFLLYTRPFARASAPRSVVLGHGVAIACGWVVWGVVSAAAGAPVSLLEPGLAVCASASACFAVTSVMLMRLRCPHPPACASALIVATGAMTAWPDLLVMVCAVVVLTYQSVAVYRLAGVRAPVWRADAWHRPSGDGAACAGRIRLAQGAARDDTAGPEPQRRAA